MCHNESVTKMAFFCKKIFKETTFPPYKKRHRKKKLQKPHCCLQEFVEKDFCCTTMKSSCHSRRLLIVAARLSIWSNYFRFQISINAFILQMIFLNRWMRNFLHYYLKIHITLVRWDDFGEVTWMEFLKSSGWKFDWTTINLISYAKMHIHHWNILN